jgi:hypothetical protein
MAVIAAMTLDEDLARLNNEKLRLIDEGIVPSSSRRRSTRSRWPRAGS